MARLHNRLPIAICGALIATTTYFVKSLAWDPMLAMLAVGAVALIVPLVITLAITAFVPAPQRREIWGTVWKTAKDDLKEVVLVLRFRR